MGIWAPAHWGLGKIDGLLEPQGKASNLLTDQLITGLPLMSEPVQEMRYSQTIHTISLIGLDGCMLKIMKHILSALTSLCCLQVP